MKLVICHLVKIVLPQPLFQTWSRTCCVFTMVCMCLVTQSHLTLCDPMVRCSSSILWDFPGKNTGVGFSFPFRGSSWPRGQSHVFCIALAGGFFGTEPPEKPTFTSRPTLTSSSNVQMWEVDHKEGWAPKHWCFWTVVPKETLESPLNSKISNRSILKEINPEYSWGGLILKLKLQYFGHLMWKLTRWKRPWCWERLRARGEGGDRGWDS